MEGAAGMTAARPAHRRLGLLITAALLGLVGSLALPGSAYAHVTVSVEDPTPGAFTTVIFNVPNESPDSSTVGLRVDFPVDVPLAYVQAQSQPAWTVRVERSKTNTDVKGAHGETAAERVSAVVWEADAGGVGPDEFGLFTLSLGPLPDVAAFPLPAVQTYADGTEAAWVEVSDDPDLYLEYPAPLVELTGDRGEDEPGADGDEQADAASADRGADAGRTVDAAPSPAAATWAVSLAVLLAGASLLLAALAWRRAGHLLAATPDAVQDGARGRPSQEGS